MSRVLVIGDVHCPVQHHKYLRFCKNVAEEYETNRTIFIGDVIDWHAISFHTKNPDSPGPLAEYHKAKKELQKYYRAFPKATVLIGNHDKRPERLAETTGIPQLLLKSYNELWGTKGWKWVEEIDELDGVHYFHGVGYGGMHPAYNAMRTMQMSVVMGHVHCTAGIEWAANPQRKSFGMNTGCGIDRHAAAMVYGKPARKKPTLGCGVVLNGKPYYEIMDL